MASDNQLEQMKQKYASVLTTIQQQQIRLSHVHIQDNKLFIEGLAPKRIRSQTRRGCAQNDFLQGIDASG
jgi:hypothetical protein